MPTDTTVKFYNSSMPGAPVLSGSAGAMLAVLQACLVDGWGAAAVDSVVVASGVATVTRASGHPFLDGQVALMAGATPTALNGEKKLTVINPTKFSFDAAGVPDGLATGTITYKVASLGWVNPFASSGNVGVFKSADPASTGCVLRMSDTGTTNARVLGYEQMVDLNNGKGGMPALAGSSFPTEIPGGLSWPKSEAASTAARNWWLVGDGRTFYLGLAYTSGLTSMSFVGFGDLASVRTGFPDCFIFGVDGDTTGTSSGGGSWGVDYSDGATQSKTYLARAYSNLGGSTGQCYKCAPTFGTVGTGQRSGASGLLPFPNGADGGIYVSPNYVSEPSRHLRGSFPGLWFLLNSVGTTLQNGTRFQGAVNLPGRQLMTLNSGSGAVAFDVTGPWR